MTTHPTAYVTRQEEKELNTRLVREINTYWRERGFFARARVEPRIMKVGDHSITREVIVSDLRGQESEGTPGYGVARQGKARRAIQRRGGCG